MVNHWLKSGIIFLLVANVGMAQAQSTGVAGFFQRAGAAIQTGASQVLGKPAASSGTATTKGAYFRPISPAAGGQFQGLFDHWKQGDAWPRAAIYFTRWGTSLPCWSATATIWFSQTRHHDETFQICNAPLTIRDDMGGTQTLGATGGFDPSQTSFKIDSAQNIQGISHADSSSVRDTGPNPPHNLFALNWGSHRALLPQYYEIVLRSMYACGYEDPTSKGINTMAGKSLWVVGFDQAGNADAGATP